MKLVSFAQSIFRSIVDVLFPPKCPICGNHLLPGEQTLCHRCNDNLPRTNFYGLASNATELTFASLGPRFKKASSFLLHSPGSLSSNLIYKIKYAYRPDLAISLGRFLAADLLLKNPDFFNGIDLLIPVPITKRRKRERGYNQSEKLAEGISQLTHIPIDKTTLRRIHFHASQTKLNAFQREQNIQGAFSLFHPEKVAGKHILLIDDVVTFGFTLKACAEELLKASETSLSILTLATVNQKQVRRNTRVYIEYGPVRINYLEKRFEKHKSIFTKIVSISRDFG